MPNGVSTSATVQTAAPPPPPPSPSALAAPFIATTDASWAAFDALPSSQRTKDKFRSTLRDLEVTVDQAPESARPLVARHAMKLARLHISAWSSVGTSAAGDEATDLVPHANKAICQTWGSTWVGEVDTLSALMSMGFLRIVCPTKTWMLKDEASVCYLWYTDPDEPSEKGPATVWSNMDYFRRAQVIGKQTGDTAMMQYLALMSKGANTFVAGKKTAIVESGQGWFRLEGDGVSGYVEPSLCHHTSTK